MRLRLIAVGTRMSPWVTDGFEEYARRLPRHLSLKLVEIQPGIRDKKENPARAIRDETERLLKAAGSGEQVIALDQQGKALTSGQLARSLADWQQKGRDVSFLIGGPDGLGRECLDRADLIWSLSALTLPHALVRILVAEQLYRAWTILRNHPYHRG